MVTVRPTITSVLYTQLLHGLDLPGYDLLLGKTEFGNTVHQYAADLVQRFENLHFIPHAGQVARAGQSRRTAADDRYLVSVALDVGSGHLVGILDFPVADEALQLADSHRLALDSQNAGAFALALLRADAAANARQRAVLGDNGGSRSEITLHDLMDEIRNTDIHRTRRHAAGILAIQAAGRFERGFLDIITVAHLLEVGGPDFRILFAHGNARNFICHSCLLSLFCGRLRHSDAEHRSILVCRKRPVVCGSVVICRARHGICDRSRAPARWRGHALPACGTYPDGASLRRNRPGTRRIRGHRHR